MGRATATAAPERARWPRLAAAPHRQLRSLLPRGYAGFTEATVPRHLVLPATTSVPLVVKILDSPHRPPAFIMGARDSSTVVDGDCAPSYLELWLAPLGAYTLLGLPMDELSGQLVDLADVLGPAGRRLAEQLRETRTWRQRFAVMDQFLLRRLASGPQPSPEVGWAWQSAGGQRRRGADRPDRRRGGLEPPAPDRQVQAASRADAEDRGPAGPPRRGVAAHREARAAGLGPGRGRRRLRRPGAPDPGLPPVHRDHAGRSSWPAPSRPSRIEEGRSNSFKTSPSLLPNLPGGTDLDGQIEKKQCGS